jgi:hypothetical protein
VEPPHGKRHLRDPVRGHTGEPNPYTHGRRKIGYLSGFWVVVERMLSMPVGGNAQLPSNDRA